MYGQYIRCMYPVMFMHLLNRDVMHELYTDVHNVWTFLELKYNIWTLPEWDVHTARAFLVMRCNV